MKLYILGFAVIALALSHLFAYRLGSVSAEKSMQAAVIKFKEKEEKILLELEASQKSRRIIYRDKIKVVKESTDSCLSTNAPDDIIRLFD